jgi:hypothetical protein
MDLNLDAEALRSTIDRHSAEPHVSINEHIRRLCQGLGISLSRRRAIYLDTRYWIFLRDAALGCPQKPAHAILLTELQSRVVAGDLFCPLSDATFCELLKQTRPDSRQVTSEIVDQLSLGVALCGEHQRMSTELYYLLNRNSAGSNLAPIAHMVWVRLPYVLGFTYPSQRQLPSHVDLVLQKAFTDYLWSMSMVDIVRVLDGSTPPGDYNSSAQRLNASNAQHADEVRDFRTTYIDEIAGGLELFAEFAAEIIEKQMTASGETVLDSSQTARRQRVREAHAALISVAQAGRGSDAFPTLHAHAKCHTAIRRDKRRRLRGNDLIDFHHALGAVVYCDAFFTDNPMRVFLTTSPVALDVEFACNVISDESAALSCVRTL